jgi:hypothetical protein
MKHFVYAFYSPSYEMVKIGKSSNIENRWKQLSHWRFSADKSFALCCNSQNAQKRIEDTLKIFFERYPSIEALSTNQDGYTECFDIRIMEDVRDFFQYFSKRYSNDYTYVENIKPFLNLPKTYREVIETGSMVYFSNTFSDEVVLSDDFEMKIISKKEAIDFLGIDPADF